MNVGFGHVYDFNEISVVLFSKWTRPTVPAACDSRFALKKKTFYSQEEIIPFSLAVDASNQISRFQMCNSFKEMLTEYFITYCVILVRVWMWLAS